MSRKIIVGIIAVLLVAVYIFAGERKVGDKLVYDNFNEDEVRYFIQATD